MYNLVLDIEMCKVPKMYRSRGYKRSMETIEIGTALYDENWEKLGTLCMYVRPQYGVIDHFISNLTGIQAYQLKNAPVLKDALEDLVRWIGEKEYKVYTWSGTDRKQILSEIHDKQLKSDLLDDFMMEERWIDYQAIFSGRFSFDHDISLANALEMAEVEAEGRAHDGLVDAVNTGSLIKKLEQNPDCELVQNQEEWMETEPLSSSMGNLFAALGFACA